MMLCLVELLQDTLFLDDISRPGLAQALQETRPTRQVVFAAARAWHSFGCLPACLGSCRQLGDPRWHEHFLFPRWRPAGPLSLCPARPADSARPLVGRSRQADSYCCGAEGRSQLCSASPPATLSGCCLLPFVCCLPLPLPRCLGQGSCDLSFPACCWHTRAVATA